VPIAIISKAVAKKVALERGRRARREGDGRVAARRFAIDNALAHCRSVPLGGGALGRQLQRDRDANPIASGGKWTVRVGGGFGRRFTSVGGP